MNWFGFLLIFGGIVACAGFGYLVYLLWKEISLTLKEVERTRAPIVRLMEEIRTLQPLVESLSVNANQRAIELREIIELSKATTGEVTALATAIGAFRSPNVQLAVRYGKDWMEERRMHPILRKLKGIIKKIRKRFGK